MALIVDKSTNARAFYQVDPATGEPLAGGGEGLTDAELRADPVPVSGTVATGGLTDDELRAAPVPVSGTVTATGPLTDAQLRAAAVPVSGPQTNTEFLAALRSTTGTRTVVSSTTAETLGLAGNANRKGAKIINTDANTLWLVYNGTGGDTPTAANYYEALATGDDHVVDFGYTGDITFAWAADGAGVAIVWEIV